MDFSGIAEGSIVVLGGTEWEVILRESGRFLLFARDVLRDESGICHARFHNRVGDATWESSSLRAWLNSAFLERFSADELAHICPSRVVNYDSTRYRVPGGPDTVDRVFCLSVETVRELLSEEQMKASNCWYLRSPGFQASYAANVRENGGVFEFGRHAFLEFYGIRPAMWLSPEPCGEDSWTFPFVSLFGFDGMGDAPKMRLAMAYLASFPENDRAALEREGVGEFLRRNMASFADAAFLQPNVEEIVLGAMRAGLINEGNVDDFMDRARAVENWSLVADLLEHRAYGVSFEREMTEEERLEAEIFGDLF